MAALSPTEAVQKRFDDELQKLSVLETGSPEYGVTRNYLDWLTSIPWGQYSEDNLDLKHAKSVLEAHHSGLQDVKDRIVEFLAVGALRGEVKGSIILLVGPPGLARPVSANPSPKPWDDGFTGSAWAACEMKQRSRGTAAPTSAPCPASWHRPSRKPAPAIQ